MASIQQRGKGSFLIQFYDKNGKHRGVSLSGVTKKVADDWARRIEILNTSQRSGYPIDGSTADWLQELGDIEAGKLAKVGLVEARAVSTLGDFLANHFKSQKRDWAERTLQKHNTTKRYLTAFFKADKRLRDVTPADADAFLQHLKHEVEDIGSDATISKHVSNARGYFNAAIKNRLISSNPFKHIKLAKCVREEFYHITPEIAQKVLDACPDSQWRMIFAFARYGGLRIPSELNDLQWSHVNWEDNKILIHSPKTKRHKGKDKRFIPIFPELRPYLEEGWEIAQERGDKFVISVHRTTKGNLSPSYLGNRMRKLIELAGVIPWDDLFKNCRSTRETELADTFPEHVACAWIGNSVAIARKHYLRVTDDHFRLGAATSTTPAKMEEKTEAAKPAKTDDVDPELMTQVMTSVTDIVGHDATDLVERMANVLGWPALAHVVYECQNGSTDKGRLALPRPLDTTF